MLYPPHRTTGQHTELEPAVIELLEEEPDLTDTNPSRIAELAGPPGHRPPATTRTPHPGDRIARQTARETIGIDLLAGLGVMGRRACQR